MDLDRLRKLIAAPMASVFMILILCVFVVEQPVSTGILIPMMRARAEPLQFCELNGFTVYLHSDGRLAGGSRDDVESRGVLLSRIREARDQIQDHTIFVITDPDAIYGDLASLVADIHHVAPPDHIAVVTQAGLFEASNGAGIPLGPWAERCRFEWPAVPGQPTWPAEATIPLPGGRLSVRESLFGRRK